MITILLEQIIQLLTGWIEKFNNHAEAVENSLDTLNATAADIETNTDPIPEIRDNTGAVITPINNIKTNTDTIATNTATTASNTTIIKNNINTIATNTGSASAFAEACANNTLDIKDKVTTIASDTTQIRATDTNIYGAVNDIKDLMQYYFLTNIVTEEVESYLCNFDTDLEDYLQKAVVTIPADAGGYSSLDITKTGKNLVSFNDLNVTANTNTNTTVGTLKVKAGITYTVSCYQVNALTSNTRNTINVVVNGVNNFESTSTNYHLAAGVHKVTFTPTTDQTATINFWGNTLDVNNTYTDWQIEVGSEATDFEEYKYYTDAVSLGSTITDGAKVDLLSGIVTINTTPVTYSSITPIAIRTYKGVNNIFSDIGSMDVVYRETLKHYLDKNNQ